MHGITYWWMCLCYWKHAFGKILRCLFRGFVFEMSCTCFIMGSRKALNHCFLFSCHSLYCWVSNYFFIGTSMDETVWVNWNSVWKEATLMMMMMMMVVAPMFNNRACTKMCVSHYNNIWDDIDLNFHEMNWINSKSHFNGWKAFCKFSNVDRVTFFFFLFVVRCSAKPC